MVLDLFVGVWKGLSLTIEEEENIEVEEGHGYVLDKRERTNGSFYY